MVRQKYFGGWENERLGGQKYTKYNKINNSENFRGARLLPGGAFAPSGPLSCTPGNRVDIF